MANLVTDLRRAILGSTPESGTVVAVDGGCLLLSTTRGPVSLRTDGATFRKGEPSKKKGQKVSKADVAIGKIRKLYQIEERIKDLAAAQKTEQREKLSRPVLDDLHTWLQANSRRVPRDSLTAKAIQYTLNQWNLLIGYCDDGRLHISNALAENAIRPFALGRRNWLFADTSRGAKASASCYSLIETAKANGLEPYAYLQHVLQHIAAADTLEKIEALLPWNLPRQKKQEG